MARFFPPKNLQANSHQLRNKICPLGTPEAMAEVSSHLRNFAVAEVIGFVGMLDGHPRIVAQPVVREGPARFQQARGTAGNPFAHAIPSNMLLNGESLVNLYRSPEARAALERVFGMGVMAPEDWENQDAFSHDPKQLNVVDNISERYHYGAGLVEAFWGETVPGTVSHLELFLTKNRESAPAGGLSIRVPAKWPQWE